MSFNNLSIDVQNILLASHDYIIKWFVFLALFFISVIYVFYVWPNHEKTIFFTRAFARVIFYFGAVSYLLISPMGVLLLTYKVSFFDFYTVYFVLYGVFISVMMIILLVDMFYYGILGMLGLAGIDFLDDRVNDLVKWFMNNKHFMKMNGFIVKGWKKNNGR